MYIPIYIRYFATLNYTFTFESNPSSLLDYNLCIILDS